MLRDTVYNMPRRKKMRKKVKHSLNFDSDSNSDHDTDSDVSYAKNKRIRERSLGHSADTPEFSREINVMGQSESSFGSEAFIKTVCSELRSVLNEKKKLFQQYTSGAKDAYEANVSKIWKLWKDDEQFQNVNDEIKNISEEFISLVEKSTPMEEESLNSINNLLKSLKDRRSQLQDKIDRLQNVHHRFREDMKIKEENYRNNYTLIEKELKTMLKTVQRKIIEQMQKKAMEDLKQSWKGQYLAHLKQEDD